jgi:hypothetical protein
MAWQVVGLRSGVAPAAFACLPIVRLSISKSIAKNSVACPSESLPFVECFESARLSASPSGTAYLEHSETENRV